VKYRVRHKTVYDYSEAVSICHSTAHVQPRATPGQQCARCDVSIEPSPDARAGRVDSFGNHAIYFSVQRPHRQLVVEAQSEVDVATNGVDATASRPWEETRDGVRTWAGEAIDAVQFVFDSPLVRWNAALAGYARQSFSPRRPLLEAAADLTARINADFTYDTTATQISTPLEEVWANRRGVCQDFAHVQLACLRSLGLPARYVSGYVLNQQSPGQPQLIGGDASHAWVSVFAPECGWVDFDPTNNVRPGGEHVTLAWGRDFSDVSPIRGVILGGGRHTVSVCVEMMKLQG